jgi:hypothetical protein
MIDWGDGEFIFFSLSSPKAMKPNFHSFLKTLIIAISSDSINSLICLKFTIITVNISFK